MAEAHRSEARPFPQRPFRPISKPPPDGCHAMGASAHRGESGPVATTSRAPLGRPAPTDPAPD
eukprot:13632977-Alexandrium_andersonii.AAC.1